MHSGLTGKVNQVRGLAGCKHGCFDDGSRVAGNGHDRAIVILVE